MSPYIMYDDMMNGIWYSSADGLEIGEEVNVPNSVQTYTWQEIINKIQDFVDPNDNTIQLSNGQNVRIISTKWTTIPNWQCCQSLAYMLPIQ